MNALVLTTRPADNLYGDTAQTYSFPPQYLRWFAPLLRGEEMVAVLYEPRRGRGRESYVAWVTLREPPHPDPANPAWWRITYSGCRPSCACWTSRPWGPSRCRLWLVRWSGCPQTAAGGL